MALAPTENMGRRQLFILCFTLAAGLAASPAGGLGLTKDQSRIEQSRESGPHIQDSVPDEPGGMEESAPEEAQPSLQPEDVPALETVDLTDDSARRALDGYAAVHDKYNDQGLEEYETLEEFVEKTDAGKRLEAEIKAFGFADITQWNSTIMAVSFAYNALGEGQEEAIREQIADVRADKTLDESTRARMIASLNALIPSEQNKTVVRKLKDDTTYESKLKLLEDVE